jgi:hypothetical protein
MCPLYILKPSVTEILTLGSLTFGRSRLFFMWKSLILTVKQEVVRNKH